MCLCCIMAEMCIMKPAMKGRNQQNQLDLITQFCGSITPEVFPGAENLDLYRMLELPKGRKRKVKDRMKNYVRDEHALDLVDKLLCIDPAQRIDADYALDHDFFWNDPRPQDLHKMLSQHTSMFDYFASNKREAHVQQQRPRCLLNPDQYFDRIF